MAYSGLLRNSVKRIFIRRVVGKSMAPRLKPGKIIIAWTSLRRPHPGQVVIINHQGREKIKRIERIDPNNDQLFLIGDNLEASSDSRHFGWLPLAAVRGQVIWPRLHN